MRKKWIWVLLAICVLTLGLKLWLLPNWYSTNNNNIALTYDAPISDAAFDAMVKEKIGLSTPLSLAKIARFKGLKLGVAGTSTVVIQPKTSVWSLIKLLVRYQREQKLVTILSHWDYNQFQKQLSNQFDWSPVQLGEEIMDPTNHKRWNEQTWLRDKGVDPYNWQAIAIPNSYMFKRTATPIQVLNRLVNEAHDFWTKERMLAAKKFNLSPVEVVTLASIVTKESNHVPESETDFIFCPFAEEWGFLGTLFLVILYMFMLMRIVTIAERQRSVFNRVYAYTVAMILFYHFAVNIGMNIGFAPVIGIPLPLFSYGGSSLMSFSIMLFVLIKLDSQRRDVLS